MYSVTRLSIDKAIDSVYVPVSFKSPLAQVEGRIL